jgi:hypothetical protein
MRRREALIAAGGLGFAAVGTKLLTRSSEALAADCLLQREVTEGHYYLDLDLMRRNIREDRRGIPLTHSGVSGNTETFLRGIQRTNSQGWVRFETIYPGWYRGRTPHIHMKVFVSGNEVHTGQVFMKDAASAKVYGEAGRRALLSLRRKGDRVLDGFTGTLNIGVNPS